MKLFLEDAYAQTADAVVQSVLPAGITLDRTLFYARSGGQPGDTGRLTWPGGEALVGEAIKAETDIILLPLDATPPAVGTPVTTTIDWPRRFAHMRMHTALHLLCSLIPAPR